MVADHLLKLGHVRHVVRTKPTEISRNSFPLRDLFTTGNFHPVVPAVIVQ